MDDYLDLVDPREEMQDARHPFPIKVTTQADVTVDVEVIETLRPP